MENKISNNDISIYVIFHKPYLQIVSDVFKPISPKECGLNILSADTNDNISNENDLYAEYSTFYWAWKNNLKAKYIGFFHYRRYLAFEKSINFSNNDILSNLKWDYKTLKNLLNDYDLILPNKFNLGEQVYNQFCYNHHGLFLAKSMAIIDKFFPAQYLDAFNKSLKKDYGYFCNLFIAKKEIFDNYMNFVFTIFNELKKDESLKPYYETKIFAYIGERLFNSYVEYLRLYSDFRICEVPLVFIDDYDSNFSICINPQV